MRKTVIVILSILFTGALLLYTAQANLDLLTQVSPNPQFVGFAMVALEGGVLYWTGYYLLHWHGIHKGIAMVMIFICFLFSMVGFFVDSNLVAMRHSLGTSLAEWFPHVILLVGADICLNVGMGIIVHLIPDNRQIVKSDFQPLLDAGRAAKDGISNMRNGRKEEATEDVKK